MVCLTFVVFAGVHANVVRCSWAEKKVQSSGSSADDCAAVEGVFKERRVLIQNLKLN